MVLCVNSTNSIFCGVMWKKIFKYLLSLVVAQGQKCEATSENQTHLLVNQ